jgi:phosphonate transport system permease protein
VKRAVWVAAAILLVAIAWDIDADPLRLARGLPWMWGFIRRMVPPDLAVLPAALKGAVGTIEIALLGTGLAAALAIPLGFLSARNVAPPALYYAVRTALNFFRSIDTLVYALLFVAAVGLGPFAGVLGIALHTWGSTAKLWAEAIENIPAGPLEAAAVTGASRIKVLTFALVPDVAPVMLSIGLFWWEFNVRASTVLGVVGAGGIGQELKNSMDLLDFPRLLTILVIILAMVTVIDHASQWVRRRLE